MSASARCAAGRSPIGTTTSPVTIRQRLKVYHEQTAPLIGYYEGKGKLRTVDGDCAPEEVLASILAALE